MVHWESTCLHLPSMKMAMGSVPGTTKNKKSRMRTQTITVVQSHPIGNYMHTERTGGWECARMFTLIRTWY